MQNNNVNPIVVIPVHKEYPSKYEKVSLIQCNKILSYNNEIVLVYPRKLNISKYLELIPSLKPIAVDDQWMSSIKSYNKMMMSDRFFSLLNGYSHALIHEPDAIVLKDVLYEWCEKPYDYIGAPWFLGYGKAEDTSPLLGVGNFGFSLHNLFSSRKILCSSLRWYPYTAILRDLLSFFRGDFKRALRGINALHESGRLRGAYKIFYHNCDRFWSDLVPSVDKMFRVAPVQEAIRFSWETLPRRCMEMNGGATPFGLHKWYKYDFDFVCEILESNNVDISFL